MKMCFLWSHLDIIINIKYCSRVIAFIIRFVTQSQGPLNLQCSLKNLFATNKMDICRRKKTILKCKITYIRKDVL